MQQLILYSPQAWYPLEVIILDSEMGNDEALSRAMDPDKVAILDSLSLGNHMPRSHIKNHMPRSQFLL